MTENSFQFLLHHKPSANPLNNAITQPLDNEREEVNLGQFYSLFHFFPEVLSEGGMARKVCNISFSYCFLELLYACAIKNLVKMTFRFRELFS